MAQMIPSKWFETGSEGEKQIFHKLRDLLPADYIVMHSLRWTGGDIQAQGEADFVVFHPERGILVLEVKAGLIECKNREWYQTNRNTGEKKFIRDPEEQASGSKFKLIKHIKNPKCLVCHAVWFPSIHFTNQKLPPNYVNEILLDKSSLKNPKEAIDNAFSFWSAELHRTTSLLNREVKDIISGLAPSLKLVPSIQQEYQDTEQSFLQLTKDQARILDFLELQDRVTISGAAGTGKTLIAIEKARQLHANGRKVLFVCYNRLLKDYLNDHFENYGFTITNFDSLAVKHVGSHGDFELQRKLFLDYLLDEDKEFEFTDIVIDEGQDFENEWLEYLDYRIKGQFYVFFDHQQNLNKEEPNQFLLNASTRLTLTTNCRNTKAIALTSYGGLGEDLKPPLLSKIEGKQPKLILQSDPIKNGKEINQVVKRYIHETKIPLNRIAILTFEGMLASELSFMSDMFEFPWSNNYEKNSICVTTARKFKGLEADLIILTDLNWNRFDEGAYRRLFYASCSRAKYELYIVSPDIDSIDYDSILKHINPNSKRKGKRKFLKTFNFKA